MYCITLNDLYKVLDMLTKNEGHQDDKILVDIGQNVYSYNMLKGDLTRVVIDDSVYDNEEHFLKLYCHKTEGEEREIEFSDDFTIADFMNLMENIFDQNRHMFIPACIIKRIDGGEFGVTNVHELQFPHDIIKHIYVKPSHAFTFCFIIKTF